MYGTKRYFKIFTTKIKRGIINHNTYGPAIIYFSNYFNKYSNNKYYYINGILQRIEEK